MSEKLNDLISDLVDISVSWNNIGFKPERNTTLEGVKMLREQERQIKDQETRIQGLVEALEKIKVAVCGDARSSWDVSPETTETRGRIANVCDVALTAYKEGK